MRNPDPIFFPGQDTELQIKQKFQKNYTDCINILQTQWYQADLDQRFTMGDQDLWGLIFPGVTTNRRKLFNFNITQPLISTVSGYQRRNRKSSTVIPVLDRGQKTADQLTKCLFHTLNKSGIYQVYSDCFEKGALTQGLGFCLTYIDKTQDIISGDIRKRYVDMKQCLFDPYFRKHDMSDCRFWTIRTFFDRQDAAVLYHNIADEILSLPQGTYRDDKFYYMPEVYQIQFPNLIAFDEYYYLTSREATYLIDRESEECQEWEGDDEQMRDVMRKPFRKDNGQGGFDMVEGRKLFRVEKRAKPTVRRAIMINDRLLLDEKNPLGIDKYPVVPCLGYFNPDTAYYSYKFRGISRDIRDSQYLFNRMKINDLDQVEAQQSGIKMEQGALVTPDDALNSGNGRVLTTRPGYFDKVEKLHIDPPSPVLLQMEAELKNITEYISGVTAEMMGQDIDDKAGIITMIRQSASITRLMPLFDQFDEFQRLDGDLTVEVIQKNYTFGKIRQIIGEEPTEEFDNKLFFRYSCKVATGVLTESQQQMEAQQLFYAKTELGIPISSKRILSKMVLQDKDSLIKEVEEAEKQQSQMAEKRAQLEMQQMQVDNETKLAYARDQSAKAQASMSKIELDKAIGIEKVEEAKREKSTSFLNMVKALKEIQSIDLEQMEKALELMNTMKIHTANPNGYIEKQQTQPQGGAL